MAPPKKIIPAGRDDGTVKKEVEVEMQPNTMGHMKSQIREAANLDTKTEAVFLRKGYIVEEKISEGAFGQVYVAHDTKSQAKVAVKVMELAKMSESIQTKFVPREIKALSKVRHENVIRIYDIFKSAGRIYIFMEYAPGGTLLDRVKASKYLTDEKAKPWFKQIASALFFMHSIKLAHRDIKAENVLMDKTGIAKLSDFGFATDAQTQGQMSRTFCGTEPYFSPELIKREPYDPFSSDVYSLGVLLFVMVNGRFPFHFMDLKDNKNIMLGEQKNMTYSFRDEVNTTLSSQAKDLIRRMFAFEPRNRITMQGVMTHAWMR